MHVLVITPNPPFPPQQGAALRNLGILHSLAQDGAKITLLTFCERPPERVPERLTKLCERVEYVPAPPRSTRDRLRDLVFLDAPDLALRLNSDEFRSRLTNLLQTRQFDLVQLEGLEVAAYIPLIKALQPTARLIYDAHNAEFALQRIIAEVERQSPRRIAAALYSQVQSRRITRFERRVCDMVNGIIAVSEDDARHLRSLGTKTPVFTLPNGIFVDEYAGSSKSLNLVGEPLVFTGKMDYRPNVDAILWFADSIFPGIVEKHPDVHLYVVGQNVHSKLLPLQESSTHISFTRWVESVQPFLHEASVFVAPLRMGSGTRLKILEAMAAGCPIIATSIAASGLDEGAEDALVTANTAEEFTQAVNRLLDDEAERNRLSIAARKFVRNCYDWSILAPKLCAIYAELCIG